MSIEYTYRIVSVDEAARCMEIIYSANGHQTMHISARLPFVGESLESIIDAYAPVPLWIDMSTPVSVPQVGISGTVTPVQNIAAEPEPITFNIEAQS
jgi:hypothetical protein